MTNHTTRRIRNPVDLGYTEDNIELWRNQVRSERRYQCADCKGFGGELHETIVTRQDARGLPPERRLRIFSDCNMVTLCKPCHEKRHGTKDARGAAFAEACAVYGESAMREWYAGFEFRSPEARFMPSAADR